ncbi:hypothetical protein AAG570_010793, partial [Ranatra chinensis]
WIPPSHCRGGHRWVEGGYGEVPCHAVHAGQDQDGGPIYAGRAFHEGDLIPAKVTPTHGCAFVPYAGTEHSKRNYEVLCCEHVAWQFSQRGQVPPEAICFGRTRDGEPLYMGRVLHEGTLTPGKIHPSHGCLYIPFGGQEIRYDDYEVLVMT